MHRMEAKSILSAQNGMNLCRGCLHGCIYCDSRSTCYQINHDFEDIAIKANAPELLEKALRSKRRKCMIGTGSMSDPYLPQEDVLALTRRCLELIAQYDFGAAVLTKSDLVLRDLDLLKQINRQQKAVVQMTLTTFDESLCRIIEPHVCTTARRAEVLRILHENGIPTVVWLTPLLPWINDTEENIRPILEACVQVRVKGIICFDMGLTLREGDREYYYAALDKSFPGMKERYIKRYGNSYELPSPKAKELEELFQKTCKENGIMSDPEDCFRFMSEFPEKYQQMSLFDDGG